MSKKATHIFFYTLHGPIKNRFVKHDVINLNASNYALIGATESHALPIKKKELYNTRNITLIDKVNKIYKIYN